MFTPSIKIGEVNGVDLKISAGWIAIFIWLTASLRKPEAYNRYLELIDLITLGHITLYPAFPQSQLTMLGFTITLLTGIYLSVIFHEIGHATAAYNRGIEVESVTLWIAGGLAKIETIPSMKELPITIAGPAVTATLVSTYAIITAILFELNITVVAWIFLLLSLFNFLMLIFNLLPLFPLDGGRIFRSLLTRKTNYLEATKYAFYTTITVITVSVGLMITFSHYDYLFISGVIGFLGYINYKNFDQTYNPENVVAPSDFFIYEHTFAFEADETITEPQRENITTHIKKQGGKITQENEKADYIVSTEPLKFQRKSDTNYIHPLLIVQKLDRNGANLSQEFKNQFKL
jgi:Zn-dependent protease